jgi:betaine-aldehyde dehydrogenase
MAAWKVAPALAAGCTIVLKPSELCSLSCEILAEILDRSKVPAGVFNLVSGTGIEAGQPLSDHPLVDKLAFTGSVATGRKVMQAASGGIRSISLELGGKSSFIVFSDCDLEKAGEWILFGIFWNKGEVCSATSRILFQREIFAPLLERNGGDPDRLRRDAGCQTRAAGVERPA